MVVVVNPDKEEGRVTLITRYGAGKVRRYVPVWMSQVLTAGRSKTTSQATSPLSNSLDTPSPGSAIPCTESARIPTSRFARYPTDTHATPAR